MDFEFDLLLAHALKRNWTCQEASRTTSYSYLFMARAGLPSSFYTKFLVGVTCGGFRDWIPIVNPLSIVKNTKVPRVLGSNSHNGHWSIFLGPKNRVFFCTNLPVLKLTTVDETLRENWGCHFFCWFLTISFFWAWKNYHQIGWCIENQSSTIDIARLIVVETPPTPGVDFCSTHGHGDRWSGYSLRPAPEFGSLLKPQDFGGWNAERDVYEGDDR